MLPLLNDNTLVREPVGSEPGYWVGAPGIFYAHDEKAFYLTYRIRRPRGVSPDRGGEIRIARSADGLRFDDIWSGRKEQFDTASIERCALLQCPDRSWRYFVSFVDPADGRWAVGVIHASEISQIDPGQCRLLFRGPEFKLEGIKDPWIRHENGIYYMFLSVALPTAVTTSDSHSTLDIFNTGECVSATALATSSNLENWDWQGVVFAPTQASSWDSYCRRINSVVRHREQFIAFYDGSSSHLENYEEKTGLAVSTNLRDWRSITPHSPFLTSPHASGSLRYLDAMTHENDLWLYFELARLDGAHELRASRTSPNFLAF